MVLLVMLSLQGINDEIMELREPGKDAVEFMSVFNEENLM